MGEFDRSTQFGDLKGAVSRAKKYRGMSKSEKATIIGLVGTGILAAAGLGSGIYALATRETEPEAEHVAGQFLVKFDNEIVPGYQLDGNVVTGLEEVDALNDELQGETYEQVAEHSDQHELDNWYLIDIDDSLDLDKVMREFADAEGVELVGYDIILTADGGNVPNDYYFSREGTIKPGLQDMWGLWGSGALDAWEITTGDDSLVFAVLDTGIADDHPELINRMWRNTDEIEKNGIDDDNDGYIDNMFGANTIDPSGTTYDGHGHGSHVAGTIAAETNNVIGVAGINWYGKLMAVKVLSDGGSGSLSGIAKGVVFAADNGANLINMSLGGRAGGRTVLDEAIDYADSKGVSVIVAAGNSNADAKNFTPANHPLVITVAALGPGMVRTDFSNWGDTVDVAAPGQYILSTVPAKHGIPTSRYQCWKAEDGKNNYCELAGTSMASPMTAGLVGLIQAANPDLVGNTQRIREIVRAAVRPYESDKYIGTGRIDYGLAVRMARDE